MLSVYAMRPQVRKGQLSPNVYSLYLKMAKLRTKPSAKT